MLIKYKTQIIALLLNNDISFQNMIRIYNFEQNYESSNFIECKFIVNVFIQTIEFILFQNESNLKIKFVTKTIIANFIRFNIKIDVFH